MSHQAGPQLDLLIAEKLSGLNERRPGRVSRPPRVEQAPRYSTDIAAAWQLVGWMQVMGFEVAVMTTAKERAQLGAWTCAVGHAEFGLKSSGATAALAISRAMLAILTEFERNSGART